MVTPLLVGFFFFFSFSLFFPLFVFWVLLFLEREREGTGTEERENEKRGVGGKTGRHLRRKFYPLSVYYQNATAIAINESGNYQITITNF